MIVTLHERGLITRVPGQPRSITLLVAPEALPPLQPIKNACDGVRVEIAFQACGVERRVNTSANNPRPRSRQSEPPMAPCGRAS
jgi:hypothetical protein